ncbi:MAG: hypothetical protein GTO03_02665, partial [Planctomycetales bacterium]|nr:hypothetical protein [Planctomycetales bacterium]
MHQSQQLFLESISPFLGFYYLALATMNAVAAYYLWHYKHRTAAAVCWLVVAAVLVGYFAPMSFSGEAEWVPSMPQPVRHGVDAALGGSTGAVIYSVGTLLLLWVLYAARGFFVKPMVAWTGLNLSLLALGL